MKILAIDSTSKNLSICISEDNEILSSVNDARSSKHMENIIADIDKAFKNLSFGINDIDLFAVGLGPGDFTGSRIGISVIKTFSMLSGREALGFNALDVFTISSLFKNMDKIEKRITRGGKVIIIPLMDVRNHEIFFSLYEAAIVDADTSGENIKDVFKKIQDGNVVFIYKLNDKNILIKKLYDENVLIKKDEFFERFCQLLEQIKKLNQYSCSCCSSIFSTKIQDKILKNTAGVLKNNKHKETVINYILTGNAFSSYIDIFNDIKNKAGDIKDIKVFIEKNNRYTDARYISLLSYFRAVTDSGNTNIAPLYVRDFIPFGRR